MKRKRKRKQKRLPKKIVGLTYLQKLSIESAIEFAADRAELDEGFEFDSATAKTLHSRFRKLLATFRKKTKHMRPPRQRRKRKNRGAK